MENVRLRGHRLAEPLTFEIACSAGPHPATIETDWSVTFPFDWESERVVCALAGVSHSCEHLEVQVGSVAQTALLRLHAKPYPIRFVGPGEWTIGPRIGLRTRFVSAVTAAHKLRKLSNIGHFHELMQALLPQGPGGPSEPWAEQARSIVAESDGVDIAWAAGVHPRRLVDAWAALGRPMERPSVYTCLKVVYGTLEPQSATPSWPLTPVDSLPTSLPVSPDLDTDGLIVPLVVDMLYQDPDFHDRLTATMGANPAVEQNLLHRAIEQVLSTEFRFPWSTDRPLYDDLCALHLAGANHSVFSHLLDLSPRHWLWSVDEDVFATLYAVEAASHAVNRTGIDRLQRLSTVWRHHYPESFAVSPTMSDPADTLPA